MTQSTQTIKVVFGAMTFGEKGKEQARVHDLSGCAAILDVLQKHGHNEVDTARTYCGGTSEAFLGKLGWAARGLAMDTKLAPNRPRGATDPADTAGTYTHRPETLEAAVRESLAALQTDAVDLWYLHAPDRTVPFEDTLREVDRLHRLGLFRRFGLSNYAAWEVAQIAETCRRHNWKAPDVYQGVYNALHRAVEPELLPCLRHYGIALYAYNPIAGGLLTDRYDKSGGASIEPGSRFDPARSQGAQYRGRYWNDTFFAALDAVRPVARAHDIPTAAAALRWLAHHSALRAEHGDAVLLGASSAGQLEGNLTSLEQGPLPDAVVQAFEEAWKLAQPACEPYFR